MPLTIECDVHFRPGRTSHKKAAAGPAPAAEAALPAGRVPRISRLMALAIRFDQLIRDGVVADYTQLARLGRVSKARVSQVMSLLQLAPAIQEEILFLPLVERGRQRLRLVDLQPIAAELDWREQGRMWKEVDRGGCRVAARSQQ